MPNNHNDTNNHHEQGGVGLASGGSAWSKATLHAMDPPSRPESPTRTTRQHSLLRSILIPPPSVPTPPIDEEGTASMGYKRARQHSVDFTVPPSVDPVSGGTSHVTSPLLPSTMPDVSHTEGLRPPNSFGRYSRRSEPPLGLPRTVSQEPSHHAAPSIYRHGQSHALSLYSVMTADDAYLDVSWKETLHPKDVMSWDIYRGALIECIGTMLFTWSSAVIILIAQRTGLSDIVVAIVHALVITLLVIGMAAPSSGHLNPVLTGMAVGTGINSLPRGIAYILAQCAGAIAGGFMALAITTDRDVLPRCAFSSVHIGSAIANEFMATLFFCFIVWYCVVDPRQGRLVWKDAGAVGPLLIGTAVGIGVILGANGGPVAGLGGAGFNPARCIGLAVASGSFDGLWVYCVAPAMAVIVQSFVYNLVPPYHTHYYKLKRQRRRKASHTSHP